MFTLDTADIYGGQIQQLQQQQQQHGPLHSVCCSRMAAPALSSDGTCALCSWLCFLLHKLSPAHHVQLAVLCLCQAVAHTRHAPAAVTVQAPVRPLSGSTCGSTQQQQCAPRWASSSSRHNAAAGCVAVYSLAGHCTFRD
jgi:hypothetical protein